jgi:cell division protein FtsL
VNPRREPRSSRSLLRVGRIVVPTIRTNLNLWTFERRQLVVNEGFLQLECDRLQAHSEELKHKRVQALLDRDQLQIEVSRLSQDKLQ